MKKYFLYLRGINVGGHHKVPMADLCELLTGMGFEEVKTVLNSGNVAVNSAMNDPGLLEQKTEHALEETFGFPVPVIAREADRIGALLENDPFAGQPEGKEYKWLVTFLKHPVKEHPEIDGAQGLEIIYRANDLVCMVIDLNTYGSPDAMKLLEGGYGKEITSRTWQTMEKLYKK